MARAARRSAGVRISVPAENPLQERQRHLGEHRPVRDDRLLVRDSGSRYTPARTASAGCPGANTRPSSSPPRPPTGRARTPTPAARTSAAQQSEQARDLPLAQVQIECAAPGNSRTPRSARTVDPPGSSSWPSSAGVAVETAPQRRRPVDVCPGSRSNSPSGPVPEHPDVVAELANSASLWVTNSTVMPSAPASGPARTTARSPRRQRRGGLVQDQDLRLPDSALASTSSCRADTPRVRTGAAQHLPTQPQAQVAATSWAYRLGARPA